jgi:Uma2 family endonuclease
MSEMFDIEYKALEDEGPPDMGSLHHSTTQANLTGMLINNKKLAVLVELSLDTKQIDLSQFGLKAKDELKPDVCAYIKHSPKQPSPKKPRLDTDVLKVPKMPELAIEVLSPSQSINELLRKFDAFFALGIKSCWLVIPSLEIVKVFSQDSHKTFDIQHDTEVIDESIDIRLSLQKIFEKFDPEEL